MMESFSPVTRRILALGIAVLALLGLVNLLLAPLFGFTADSLSALADTRFQLARLEAIAARPAPPRSEPVPASLYASAPSRQVAVDVLVSTIGATAAAYEVRSDAVAPLKADPSRPDAIALSLALRGDEDKILALINELERGQPAVHFTNWSLAPDVQLDAGPPRLIFSGTGTVIWKAPA